MECSSGFLREAPLDMAGSFGPLLHLGWAVGSRNDCPAKAHVGIGPRKTHEILTDCRSPIGWRALVHREQATDLLTWQFVPV